MASKAKDDFNRPDATTLGVADTGQPWLRHRGSAQIKSGRAVPGGSRPGDIHTVNVGVGGGDATVSMAFPNNGGGQALYFRVVDASNWWRLSRRQYTYSYTYQSGTTPETYGYVGNGTYRYEPAGGWVFSHTAFVNEGEPFFGYEGEYSSVYDNRVNVWLKRVFYETYTRVSTGTNGTRAHHYKDRTVYENQSYVKTGGGEPIYSTANVTVTQLQLEKCANGVVKRLLSKDYTPSALLQMSMSLSGDVIKASVAGALVWTVTDPAYKTASRHGVGFAESSEIGNSLGIESFEATPFVIVPYVPRVML